MKKLKTDIEKSGLLKSFIAYKVGVSVTHFSLMLSGKATMPEEVRNKITRILAHVAKISA